MPDLLIVSKTPDTFEVITRLAESRNYRVRVTHDLPLALSWLDTRRFDLLLVHADLEITAQQELAGKLWKSNNGAPFIVFDLEGDRQEREGEVRLYGADLVTGPKALTRIERYLTQPEHKIEKDQFRILVVEDLESPRDIICAYLEGLGYGLVDGCSSAAEALKLLTDDPKKYSCVMTDIRMPQITGKELIESIRHHPKLNHLPIIVLTAYGTTDTLIDCLRVGASGFLVKPPKKADLTRELARATRIIAGAESPRLTTPGDAEQLREVLLTKGLV